MANVIKTFEITNFRCVKSIDKLTDSELHKHIIERERLKFYSLYPGYEDKQKIDMPKKIKEIEKCYKYKCCCCC